MIKKIKQMRAIADIPVMDCKTALEATGGDIPAALEQCRHVAYRRAAGHRRGVTIQVGF